MTSTTVYDGPETGRSNSGGGGGGGGGREGLVMVVEDDTAELCSR